MVFFNSSPSIRFYVCVLWIVVCTFSFGHCVVCFSLKYRFWLPLWYLQDIMLSVLPWCSDSDYPFGILKTLCCLFFFEIRILITPLYLQDTILSALLWYTDSDYPFGIFKTLCCLFFFDLRFLTTPLVSSNYSYKHYYRYE